VSAPAIWWVPLVAAALAFGLNQAQRILERLRARWTVAFAVHREATAAAILLAALGRNISEVIEDRLRSKEPLFFLSDEQAGSVFSVFGDDLRFPPREVATPALDYFESHALLSAMLAKMESARFDGIGHERRRAIADSLPSTVEETAALARRTSEATAVYLRGRYVPLLSGPAAAGLAARIASPLRRERAHWNRLPGTRPGLYRGRVWRRAR
jgi:hypothetical protein